MDIPKLLNDEIITYCRANNITNIDEFTLRLLKQGFTIEKFGATPEAKTVEKIVEKIVEVPVEKIVERVVEVPVAMVDTEISEELKRCLANQEEGKKELQKVFALNETLKKELEKNKKDKDIYGER